MDEENARKLLFQLADARSQMEMLLSEKERSLPEEVRQAIQDVEEEYKPRVELLQHSIDELEKQVKEAVLALGKTVSGLRIQAVYVPGKVVWDNKKMEGYAVAHPDVLAIKSVGRPVVTIRKVGGTDK